MNFKLGLLSVTSVVLLLGVIFVSADVSELKVGAPAPDPNLPPVTEICLGCICEAISNCNRTLTCNQDVCGLFKITWAYWADSGKPTLNSEPVDSPQAYPNCVIDPFCAARTIQGYMARFGKDCNGDGIINCYDHAAIHIKGGYGCAGELPNFYADKLNLCLQKVANVQG